MSEVIEVKWRKGSRLKGDVKKTYNALTAIQRKHGAVIPEAVVQTARNKRSVLHKYFTWDDTEAANLHRLNEARLLSRSIEVVYDDAPEIGVRAFFVTTAEVNDETRNVYLSTAEILADPGMRDELLQRAIREFNAFRGKYKDLSELAQVFAAFDDMAGEVCVGPER